MENDEMTAYYLNGLVVVSLFKKTSQPFPFLSKLISKLNFIPLLLNCGVLF